MFDSSKFKLFRFHIFSIITFSLIILLVIFADTVKPNVSLTSANDHTYLVRVITRTEQNIIQSENPVLPKDLELIRFDSRVQDFFNTNQCKVQFFMTWISPVESFSEREFFVLESLFKTNPRSCLVILSSTMDTKEGRKMLHPFTSNGFHVSAITPNLPELLKNTPAEKWFEGMKNGEKDPGEIPLAQNLSNLIRLAVLYKYGGVYLDADFIVLKDFSTLRNTIGAQSVGLDGNWTRLNNAVLVFDKNHPLVYDFLEEFCSTFDGNKWGHNGPYLVSRVVDRVAKSGKYNFTILPPKAFYPVGWTRIASFFQRFSDPEGQKWVEAKIQHLQVASYGVHLWNRESRGLKIEEGSIMSSLIPNYCVICRNLSSSWR